MGIVPKAVIVLAASTIVRLYLFIVVVLLQITGGHASVRVVPTRVTAVQWSEPDSGH